MISKRTTIVFAAISTAILLSLGTISIAEAGTGKSSSSSAQIDLYKQASKPAGQTLTLTDSYSGCLGANKGEFTAKVFSDKTQIEWKANSTYKHYCLFSQNFTGGKIVHEGTTYNIPSGSPSGKLDFSHTGFSPYSVDVEFYYK